MEDRTDWALFDGPELEGRLLGIRTLFWKDEPGDPKDAEIASTYDHVYFLSQYLNEHGYQRASDYVKDGKTVTLEVTPDMLDEIPPDLCQDCHLMVCIDVPEINSQVKETDTIRLGLAPFRTKTVTAGSFYDSYPAHYEVDRVISRIR